MKICLALLLTLTAFRAEARVPDQISTPRLPKLLLDSVRDPWVYSIDTMSGWTVHTNVALIHSDTAAAMKRILARGLDSISHIFPIKSLPLLRKSQIWIERNGDFRGMTYHLSASWLKQNGYNPAMASGIELSDPTIFVIDSEYGLEALFNCLMIGYGFQISESGDKSILEAYQHLLQTDLYKKVVDETGRTEYGTARNTAWDYFAVLCKAYLNRSSSYPFTRKSLREYDRAGFELVSRYLGEGR